MDGQPQPHSAPHSSCAHCGRPFGSPQGAGGALCGPCRGRFLTEVSRRSAEVRAAVQLLESSPFPCEVQYETARKHLLALSHHESRGLLRLTPTASEMLARLDALHAARRTRGAAQQAARDAREGGAVDWVQEAGRASDGGRTGVLGQPNRRAQLRRRGTFHVAVQPLGITAPTRDISLGGLYVLASSHRALGSLVRLTIHTAEGPIVTQGIVRRIDRSGSGFDARVTGFAVQFTKPPPDLLSRILH